MKKKIMAAMAALVLMFSAGMPMMTARADSYGDIIDVSDDYDETGGQSVTYTESGSTSETNNTKTIMMCIIIGCVIGGAVTFAMVSSMKSVRRQTGAADYKKPNSLHFDINTDSYLYNRIEKTPLPQQNQSGGGNNQGQHK